MTIQKYSINLVYRPGKELVIPDTLSRAFLQQTLDEKYPEELEINLLHLLHISNTKLDANVSKTSDANNLPARCETIHVGDFCVFQNTNSSEWKLGKVLQWW